MRTRLGLLALTWMGITLALPSSARSQAVFAASQAPVPAALAEKMRARSWRPGCPVAIADLIYVRLSHYGTDGAIHTGELVVHRELGAEVIALFKALFEQKFPIEKMRLIDAYDGDDDRS